MLSFFAFFVDFPCPNDGFRRVCEATAGEIRCRIRLLPCDVVDDGISFQFQGNADRINVVESPTYPNCSIVFEHASARLKPFSVKFQLFLWGKRLIPFSFIDRYLLPRVTGNTSIGKKIRRIRKMTSIDSLEMDFNIWLQSPR